MLGYLLLCLLHSGAAFAALEAKVLASARSLASSGTASRGELEAALQELVASGGGIIDPALSPSIEGNWRLLYTTKSSFDWRNPLGRRSDGSTPGLEGLLATLTGGGSEGADASSSSSPIQRAVTSAFSVTQSIVGLQSGDGRVEQLVRTPLGELHLNAAARTSDSQPRRISFTFDEGYFESEGGLRLPYPVPFRLLGDEAQGWLDTEFLSDRLRVSVGSKGTTFVLERATGD